jgi:hypothetical protein
MGKNFVWNHLPSKGSTGGILVGVDSDICEVISWEIKSFLVSCIVRNRINIVVWRHNLSMAPLMRRAKMIFSLNYMVCSFITTTPLSSVEILILLGIKNIKAMELSTRNGVTNSMLG